MTTVSENAFSSKELETLKITLAELNVSMKADIKQRWVEALRSGEYEQSQGSLKRNDAYCCLGVLCELHRQDFPGKEWRRGDEYSFEPGYIAIGAVNYPPAEVSNWAGLDPSIYEPLAEANDSGANFPTIASLIEEML